MLFVYLCFKQAHYNHLHEWLNHKWDFIVMQATEQYKYVKPLSLIKIRFWDAFFLYLSNNCEDR